MSTFATQMRRKCDAKLTVFLIKCRNLLICLDLKNDSQLKHLYLIVLINIGTILGTVDVFDDNRMLTKTLQPIVFVTF